MASTDLDEVRHQADEMEYFSRMRIPFVLWAMAMRLMSWGQAITTSRSGKAA